MDLADDIAKDQQLGEQFVELLKIVGPEDPDRHYIPFCAIYPVYGTRDIHEERYRVTCYFRNVSGSACFRTRVLGMLLGAPGQGTNEDEELLYRQLLDTPDLYDDLEARSFARERVTPEHLEDLGQRYEELESMWMDFCETASEYDQETPSRYHFAFYEHWEADEETGTVVRSIRMLSALFESTMLQHDDQCPLYKIVPYLATHWIGNEGKEALMDDVQELANDSIRQDDPALVMYALLTTLSAPQTAVPMH